MCVCYQTPGVKCYFHAQEERDERALNALRAKLTGEGVEVDGVGTVKVTFADGKDMTFSKVRWSANRMEDGFLVMEDEHGDRIWHLCDTRFWEVIY